MPPGRAKTGSSNRLMDVSEKELEKLLQRKDRRGIEILYDCYSDTLYGITLKIVQSEDIAQDVLQEAFIKIWKNGAKYDPSKGSVFTWALNITRNLAIDYIRSAAYRRRVQSENLDNIQARSTAKLKTENNPDCIDLGTEVARLDKKYKEVIDLIYLKGYTQSEVKDLLGIPLGTVKSRIRIGLRELRKVFTTHRIPLLLGWVYYALEQAFSHEYLKIALTL